MPVPVPESEIVLDLPGGAMSVFRAAPEGSTSGPAVVVLQEWWGLNEQIRGVARRVAGRGYTALAPDLYRGRQATEPDDARKLAMALDTDAAGEDLRAIVGWLLERGATGVAAIGFCMGGRLSWLLGQRDERLAAVVPFYGAVDFDEHGSMRVPFQGHFGTEDRFPPEMYETIRAHLDDAPPSELHLYEGGHHAFANEERPAYHAEYAEQAWGRVERFLAERLGR